MKKISQCLLTLLTLCMVSQVQAQEVYYIDLYTDINASGTPYRVPIYQNEKDLNLVKLTNDTNLNDKISSVAYKLPQDWEVLLWQHPNYQGKSYVISGEGQINNLGEILPRFNFNDKVSSVQWRSARSDNTASMGTKNCLLQLFEDINNKGRRLSVDCNENIGDLRYSKSDDGRRGFDNKTSSVTYNLPDGVTVNLYQHLNNRSPVLLELKGSGKITEIEELKNDRISSVQWVNN